MAVAVTQRNDFSAQAVVSEIYETECVRERAGDLTLLTALLTLASPRLALPCTCTCTLTFKVAYSWAALRLIRAKRMQNLWQLSAKDNLTNKL